MAGIAAAALLAFSSSFDDFIITNFSSGRVHDVPEVRVRVDHSWRPPQTNVIATAMFIIALAIVLISRSPAERSRSPDVPFAPSRVNAHKCSLRDVRHEPLWPSTRIARGARNRWSGVRSRSWWSSVAA